MNPLHGVYTLVQFVIKKPRNEAEFMQVHARESVAFGQFGLS